MILLLPLQALTIQDIINSKAVSYHPFIEGIVAQGDPIECRPLGLHKDRYFYYLRTIAGGCGSESDQVDFTLHRQDLVTDSTITVDSFTVFFHYDEGQPIVYNGEVFGADLERCDEIVQRALPLAPESFLRTISTLPQLNRHYSFRFPWKKWKGFGDTIDFSLRTEMIDEGRGGVVVNIKATSAQRGSKVVASYVDNCITHANPGGIIHFKGSKRAIILLDETCGRELYHFKTFGVHLTNGYK